MPDAAIEVSSLTKRFGSVSAVQDLTFAVRPGAVTGFLGPNGAGKTTTLRIILGLAEATSGTAVVQGRRYRDLDDPIRVVGASLESAGFHPGRSGRNHLRALCAMGRLPATRVNEVLRQVDLEEAADRRVKGYSMGMRQRLALAATLLGDPKVLVLDEPANGLDPQGIRWLRDMLRSLAAEGRSVLVSSHVLAEVAQTVDDVLVIDRGRLVRSGPVGELTDGAASSVIVRAPDLDGLAAALRDTAGAEIDGHPGWLRVRGVEAARIGELALSTQTVLHALYEERASLEDVFLQLTTRTDDPERPAGAS